MNVVSRAKGMARFLVRGETGLGLLLALAALCVYWRTLSPSVGFDDSGELAATLHVLGIPHPTGYPLFTLLGRVFELLPLGGRLIWRQNLLGALFCALASYHFFRIFLLLLSERSGLRGRSAPRAGESIPPEAVSTGYDRAAAAIAALALAFSRVYWTQAVSLEVYALHLLVLSVALRLFLLSQAVDPRVGHAPCRKERLWLLTCFTLGLGFANHLMTVLLAPAFLYAHFLGQGWRAPAWIRILKAVPPFALALSLYLYLPLRAASAPMMNWANPVSPDAFWRHVTGAQFRHLMFSSWEAAARNAAMFFSELPGGFGYASLVPALWGLWCLRREGRKLVFTVLLFFGCLLYAINYDIPDVRAYLLQAHCVVAIWIAFGARALLRVGHGAWRWPTRAFCVLLILLPLALNLPRVDRSRDHAVEDYARNVLASVEPGAILFSNEYWLTASPAYYLQLAEGIRPDVAVIDVGLLGGAWYYDQLESRHPWLVAAARREIDAFRAEIARDVRGEADVVAYNEKMAMMFLSILERNRKRRPLYVSSGINPATFPGYYRVPSGMVFRLLHETEEPVLPRARAFVFHPFPSPEANPMIPRIRRDYAEGYANQGAFHAVAGDTAEAIALIRKALAVEPGFVEAEDFLKGLERR